MTGPLSFELWCSIAADAVDLEPPALAELLEARGIQWEHWAAENDRWLQVLVADILARRTARSGAYGARCAEVLQRRRSTSQGRGASTADVTAEVPTDIPEMALPFFAPDGVVPALSVERYAAFVAELEAAPGERARTMARFGLRDERQFGELNAHWRRQLERSTELHARWYQLVQAQRALVGA